MHFALEMNTLALQTNILRMRIRALATHIQQHVHAATSDFQAEFTLR